MGSNAPAAHHRSLPAGREGNSERLDAAIGDVDNHRPIPVVPS